MSTLVENVAKVKSAHAALSASIEAKGVSVPAGTKLTGMPALVDQIETGGSQDYGYLTFTAVEASTLKIEKDIGIIEYQKLLKSNNATDWERWENPDTNTISLSSGQSVYIKAADDASQRTANSSDFNKFVMTGKIQVSGDIKSIVKLIVPADYMYWMKNLFDGCSPLVKAPVLSATNMIDYCYFSMFLGCTSLTQAPELPATTLASNCYASMFSGCKSLTKAPSVLPATTLYTQCYDSMFQNCTSLTSAPELPATTLYKKCYSNMFGGCTSLTQAPELPATTLANECYSSMFSYCTSLTSAPELPATNILNSCYFSMFWGCSSLKRIKMNASSGSWGANMFNGCTSLELVDMTGSTGVPQLINVNNFENTNDTYKVVVPDSLYDTWIAATNWASIASHIMKQSDWNAAHPDDQL